MAHAANRLSLVRVILEFAKLEDASQGPLLPILLKDSLSVQERKISRDMARLDREVPRAYLSTTFASPEFALIGCTES